MIKITENELIEVVKYLKELEETRKCYDIPLIKLIESLELPLLPMEFEEE